jgi:hypothetical protein
MFLDRVFFLFFCFFIIIYLYLCFLTEFFFVFLFVCLFTYIYASWLHFFCIFCLFVYLLMSMLLGHIFFCFFCFVCLFTYIYASWPCFFFFFHLFIHIYLCFLAAFFCFFVLFVSAYGCLLSRSEEILSSSGISVAPPERPFKSLSQLPYAAPRCVVSRVRLEEGEGEDGESGEESKSAVNTESGEDSESGEDGEENEDGESEDDEKNDEDDESSDGDDYQPPASGDSEDQEGENDSALAGELGGLGLGLGEVGDVEEDSALKPIQEADDEMEGIEEGMGQVVSTGDVLPPAEGSSRVTGGVLRGRALGNVLNFPDTTDLLVDRPVPAEGLVILYSNRSHIPFVHEPAMTLNTETKPTLGPILQRLGRKFSPVRSKCLSVYMSV